MSRVPKKQMFYGGLSYCFILANLSFTSLVYKGIVISGLSSPRGAPAFHKLRRYHTRPLPLNWGPENVLFGKTHFWDPNINVRIFIFLENLMKTVQSSKNAEKWPEPFLHFSEILYKDKSAGKIPFLKKLTLWFA